MAPDKRDQHYGKVRSAPVSTFQQAPADRSVPVWDDKTNFEGHLAAEVPLNGAESAAYEQTLSRGIEKR